MQLNGLRLSVLLSGGSMPRILTLANSVLTLAAFAEETGLAEGLVPVNPTKWPAFSIMSGALENPKISGEHLQWVQNLESCAEYIANSHNETHRAARLCKAGFDSFIVNAAAELPHGMGIPFAADYANQAAATYANEIVEDICSRSVETSMSMTLRLRGPKSTNSSFTKPYSYFGGTGLFGEDKRMFGFGQNITSRTPLDRGFGPGGKRPLWTYKFRGGSLRRDSLNTITFAYKLGKLGSRFKLRLPVVQAFEKYSPVFAMILYLNYCWTVFKLILTYGPTLCDFLKAFYKKFYLKKINRTIIKGFKKIWSISKFQSVEFWKCSRFLLYLDG